MSTDEIIRFATEQATLNLYADERITTDAAEMLGLTPIQFLR